jgi:hypothetical protein
MVVYGQGCHPQNIIWTEAKLRSIYYFVGDRPVHLLPFGSKCHALFAILYSIHTNLSDDMFFFIVYLRQKTSSDKIRNKTLYWSGPVNIVNYWRTALTKTNRENKNVMYNIIQLQTFVEFYRTIKTHIYWYKSL